MLRDIILELFNSQYSLPTQSVSSDSNDQFLWQSSSTNNDSDTYGLNYCPRIEPIHWPFVCNIALAIGNPLRSAVTATLQLSALQTTDYNKDISKDPKVLRQQVSVQAPILADTIVKNNRQEFFKAFDILDTYCYLNRPVTQHNLPSILVKARQHIESMAAAGQLNSIEFRWVQDFIEGLGSALSDSPDIFQQLCEGQLLDIYYQDLLPTSLFKPEPLRLRNIAQQVTQEYLVVSVLNNYLDSVIQQPGYTTFKCADLQQLDEHAQEFFTGNGANEAYYKQLISYYIDQVRHTLLNATMSSQTALTMDNLTCFDIILATKFEQTLAEFGFQATDFLQHKQRFDKHETGLAHTLLHSAGSNKLYELMKTFDQNSYHDAMMSDAMQYIVDKQPIPPKANNPQLQTLILGSGYSGKVCLAREVDINRQLVAIKKIVDTTQARSKATQELTSVDSIKQHISTDEHQFFSLPSDTIKTSGKKSEIKTYLISQLETQGDVFQQFKAIRQLAAHNSLAFNQQNYAILRRITDIVHVLEKNNLCHPDLKPENIFGNKLGDFGEIWTNGCGKLGINTRLYAPPEARSLDVFAGDNFKGYDRFALGLMFIESITGKRPHKFAINSPLWLYFSQSLQDGSRNWHSGYTTHSVPRFDEGLKREYTQYEQAILLLGKALAADKPSKRISPVECMTMLDRLSATYLVE